MQAKLTCLLLTACKISNKSNKRLMRYCTFIFQYLAALRLWRHILLKKRLKIYKMATSILPKSLTLKWNISRTIWRIEVGDGSLFCIFHALLFELNFFFDRRFPLKLKPNWEFCWKEGASLRWNFSRDHFLYLQSHLVWDSKTFKYWCY